MFCPCPETLCEAKFKGDELIYVGNFKAAQYSDSGMGVVAFIHIYSENWEQDTKPKDLKNLLYIQKRSTKSCIQGGCGC